MSFHSSYMAGSDLQTPAATLAPCCFSYPLLGGGPGGNACSALGLWTAETGLLTSEGCQSTNCLCPSCVGKAPWCYWTKSTLEVEGIIGLSGSVSNNVLEPWFASNVAVLFSSFIFGAYASVSCSIFSVFVIKFRVHGWILPELEMLPKLSHTDHNFC